jgi:hypothetical protein
MFNSIPAQTKPALIIFSSVMIIAILAVSFSLMYRTDSNDSERSAKRAMRIWQSKIDGSRESDKIVDKYERSYLDLVRKGVVGNEDRLSWFETIQYVSESRGMPSVKYSVISQKKVESPKIREMYTGLDLYRSIMTLDISMGHEGDLFALVTGLQDKAKGLFAIDKCDVERLGPEKADAMVISLDQMKASCELSWYTIKSAEQKGG